MTIDPRKTVNPTKKPGRTLRPEDRLPTNRPSRHRWAGTLSSAPAQNDRPTQRQAQPEISAIAGRHNARDGRLDGQKARKRSAAIPYATTSARMSWIRN